MKVIIFIGIEALLVGSVLSLGMRFGLSPDYAGDIITITFVITINLSGAIARKYHEKISNRYAWAITDTAKLDELVQEITRWRLSGSRISLRRIVKVYADPAIWQKAVLHIFNAVDVIIVDVSSAGDGDGLVWEIEELLSRHEGRVLFFGTHLQTPSPLSIRSIETSEARDARLVKALLGQKIIWEYQDFLTWDYQALLRRWRFRRDLRHELLSKYCRSSARRLPT